MEHNDDKTRTHVVLTKGTMVSHYRSFLTVVASIVLLACALRADDSIPDSTLPSFSHLAEQPQASCDDTGRFSYCLSGLAAIGSEEVNTGFGFGMAGFFNGFLPLVPRAGFDLFISSLDVEGLPDAEFIMFSPAFGLTLRKTSGKLRPYIGAGINLHFNHLIFDEPADVSISGYDSTTRARQIDLGWGIAPHLRLGLIIPVGGRLGLLIEGRFISVSHTADIDYRDCLTGNEWKGTVDYSMPSAWFSVGIIRDP